MLVRRDISLQSSAAFHTVFPLDYSTPPGTCAGICGACKTWQDAQFKWTGGSSAVSVAPGWSRGLAHYEGLLEVHALEKSEFFSERKMSAECYGFPPLIPQTLFNQRFTVQKRKNNPNVLQQVEESQCFWGGELFRGDKEHWKWL